MLTTPRRRLFAGLLGLGLLVVVVILLNSSSGVREGQTVRLQYRLTLDTGEEVDTSYGREPFEFVVGSGTVVPGFDAAVRGMKEGEKKVVKIPPEEGYGLWREERLQTLPKSSVPEDVALGQTLWLSGKTGQFPVRVHGIMSDSVVLDTNHPLAGKTLTFELELLEIVG